MNYQLDRLGTWAVGLGMMGALVGCKGEAPRLATVEDQVAVVGQTLSVVLVGTDPEGDDLEYSFDAAPTSDTVERTALDGTVTLAQRPDGTGLFTWTPASGHVGDWLFDFKVSDGRGKDAVPVGISVRGAFGEGSEPIFRKPIGGQGLVLPLNEKECVEVEILVEDQDSASVVLAEEPPLAPGAQLVTSPNGLEATWKWCPRKDQVEALGHYKLTLSADDGENPKVLNDFTIAVRNRVPSNSDCEGETPVIEHEPNDFNSIQDLEITAFIYDDQKLSSAPLVMYTTEKPADPPVLSDMQMVPMDRIEGDDESGTWSAKIPNPLVADENEAEEADIYYIVSASDDDDLEGAACDHITDSPDRGTHRLHVKRPADAGASGAKESGLEACDSCTGDIQCGEEDDLCLRPATGGFSFCGQSCEAAGDCSEGYVCSAREVKSVGGVLGRQCVPEGGHCTAAAVPDEETKAACASDASNRSLGSALPLSIGERPTGKMCPESGNAVKHWYQVEVTSAARLQASLSADGEKAPDFDLGLVNAAGLQVELANSLESNEAITSCLAPGTYYLQVASTPKREEGGLYLVTYDLEDDPACVTDESGNDCCETKETPGCSDAAVQTCVCEQDAFCCDVAWDAQCRAEVDPLGCGSCNLEPADCCEVSLIPGCADDAVEACVCALDDLCCDVSNGWDALCVTEVDLHGCGDCGGAQATKGLCCEANGSPGCDDPTIEACVCAEDPFCCDPQQTWDALCVSKVDELACGSCGGETPTKGDCCEGHDTPGCSDLAVQSCVCADDNWCCTNTWDALCASKVGVLGCGTCQAPEQVCTDTCQFANDQLCDDGGPESDYSACAYGSDCADCGPRDPM